MKESELKVGDKINYLTMISEPYKRNYRSYAVFRCTCGKEKEIRLSNVVSHKGTKSCGCMANILHSQQKNHVTHGKSHTKLCKRWYRMKRRCNDPNYHEYYLYGGRGIKVCEEWEKSFESFYEWAMKSGYEEHLTIDRIDCNKGYYPENCRWATAKEQSNNTRRNIFLEYNGRTQTLKQWCEELDICYETARRRYHRGLSTKSVLKV